MDMLTVTAGQHGSFPTPPVRQAAYKALRRLSIGRRRSNLRIGRGPAQNMI
jgi:hypothetical protein